MNYDAAKEHLQIRLCDLESERERLSGLAYSREGDFAASYYLVFDGLIGPEGGAIGVNQQMLQNWGVSIPMRRR